MKTKTEFGIIKSKQPEFPARELLVVPHNGKSLVVSYPAFGPNYFKSNIQEMQKAYSHPQTGRGISFTEPTTSESISAAAYDFENLAKPQIFDPSWLQLGYIVRTSEGVFANPPKDSKGNLVIDEQTLKKYLDKAEKANGIYFLKNDFGFAPYETFRKGLQDSGDFTEGGLARLLEHTKEKTAKNLRKISSNKFYKRAANVFGFDEVKEPVLSVADLVSCGNLGGGWLDVSGNYWVDYRNGYAFGVLK